MALAPLIRYLPRVLPLLGGSFFFFIMCTPVVRAESVRVLVAQDVALLQVNCEGDFTVGTEEGKTRIVRSPIHVSSRRDGLEVDGRRITADKIVIRPLKHHLSLVATHMAGTDAEPRPKSPGQ